MQDIRILNLKKRYGDRVVFDDLSLTIPHGARVALMGPSGCGKTTLLHTLMGLVRADGGFVTGLPSRIAPVFQEDRLCPWLSVRENIRIAARRASDTKISDTLAALGLAGEENTLSSELSGGMSRRVAIARALLSDGELLLLDEPFRGLDEDSRARTAACIDRMAGKRTLLLVTHDETEAALLAARVVLPRFG